MRRGMIGLAALAIAAGCTPTIALEEANDLASDAYERGLERGKREGWRAVHGGRRPESTWQGPLLRRVHVPERRRGPVLELAHEEVVIIRPGAWVEETAEDDRGERIP